jgi:hypothetical protein
MDLLLNEIERHLGPPGLQKLLDALADEKGNNWAIARRFDVTAFQVSHLRKNFPIIYQRSRKVRHEKTPSSSLRLLQSA